MIDERNGFEYELIGEQYYPTGRRMIDGVMTPSEPAEDDEPEEKKPIGIWGQRHLRYLQEHRKRLFNELFLFGQVNDYLSEVDRRVEEMFLRLIKETALQEGVTEALKAEDQMLWVQRMNNIRERATEIVLQEFIYI